MPGATGLRRKLNPALLAGAPYREGELMAGRYQIKDAVGVGPLGFVLRAQDRELGIDVSVKLIHPRLVQTGEERERFARVLEPARRFLHPSLTRLHDVGNDQGWPYFTYTFLDGLPLRRIIDSRLAKGQTFALDEVEPILGQLMSALEAAHPTGAHGNLKAENILVLPDMLKVTDWGVAGGVPRPPFIQAERLKSAQRHLAPEYLAGQELDPRADVYSLGVLLGEMLTGLTPEDEIPELRLVNPGLPDAIEGLYRRALSERPEGRFRSVREMFDAFAVLAEGGPAVADEVVEEGFEVVDVVEAPAGEAGAEPAREAAPEPPPAAVAAAVPVAPSGSPPEPAGASAVEPSVPPPPSPAELLAAAGATAAPAASISGPEAPAAPAREPPPAVPAEVWTEVGAPASSPSQDGLEAAGEQTLWSEADEERPAETPARAEPPAPAAEPEAPSPPGASAPVPPPLPPVRSLPLPAGSGRAAERPSLAAVARPVVPSIGTWGPGARRTGVQAAVAVAHAGPGVDEMPASEPPGVPPSPAAPVPLPRPLESVPASVAALHTVAPIPAPDRPDAGLEEAELPGSDAARPPPAEEMPAPRAGEVPAPPGEAPGRGHQGGLWSPGAALAELVSEIQAEEARASSGGVEASPEAELAARVAEHRVARERLALMSASEEPTAPSLAVGSPPRPLRVRPAPVSAPTPLSGHERWIGRALIWMVAFFVVGMLGALFLLRAR